jgi:hypothetical protein
MNHRPPVLRADEAMRNAALVQIERLVEGIKSGETKVAAIGQGKIELTDGIDKTTIVVQKIEDT